MIKGKKSNTLVLLILPDGSLGHPPAILVRWEDDPRPQLRYLTKKILS